jgi:hypothetical protein
MTTQQAVNLIKNKRITLGDRTFHFENDGSLLITSENEPIYGVYNFIVKDKRCYLKTNPPIIGTLKEITFDIILNETIFLLDE